MSSVVFRQTFPMPCAGVYPGLAPILVGEYGPDLVIPAGGGMLGHPDGYTAGARSWQQAIAAAMSGANIIEFAKKPENRELRRAIELRPDYADAHTNQEH